MKSLIEIEFDSTDTILENDDRLAELIINVIDPKGVDSASIKLKPPQILGFNKMDRLLAICLELYEAYMPNELCVGTCEKQLWDEMAEMLDLSLETSGKRTEGE